MTFTDIQLKAISSEKNTVVTAGAGSGKTTVLAERFLWLVREKRTPVERILTLTFTQKAAAEMYERIYGRLLQESKTSEDSFIKEQVHNFDKAQISTLDSFCLTIAGNCPQVFGLPGSFSPSPENASEGLKEFCLDFILSHQENPILKELIRGHSFETILNEFFHPLAVSYFHLAGEKNFDHMFNAQMALLESERKNHLKAFADIRNSILNMPDEGLKSLRDRKDAILAAGEDIEKALLRDGFKNLKLGKPGGKANALIEELKNYIDLYNEALAVIENIGRSLKDRENIRLVFELLAVFQTACLKTKRGQGIVTFQDIQEMAAAALTDIPELRAFYKKAYDYILIDEFQDNNDLQKRFLFLLAEKPASLKNNPGAEDLAPGKLFFVGDEKQSIYLFRGADVSVFKALSREIESSGGLSLPLSVNYRSEPGIIRFLNRIFERIFDGADKVRPDYEAEFIPLEPIGRRIPEEPRIQIRLKPVREDENEEALSAVEAEAFALAELIQDSVSNKRLTVLENGAIRPADYGDFALLMRSTGSQVTYERMFRQFGIPYVTQQTRTLFLEAPFNDMFNVLSLAAYPDDGVAYAALLRSPFVRMSDDGLLTVLLEKEKRPFSLNPEDTSLGDSDRKKYVKGKELYEDICGLIDKVPLKSVVFRLWYTYGYRYHILKNEMYHPYLDYYDYLSLLAEKADEEGICAAGFLEFMRANLGKFERLDDLTPLKESGKGVQLLSIHKSKGLQFPIVLLANTGNVGRSDNPAKAPFYISREYGLTVQLSKGENYFYTMSKREAADREHAEVKRLLYVACTRAQYHLFISGTHSPRNKNSDSCHMNMLLNALSLDAEEKFPRIPEDAGFQIIEIKDVTKEDIAANRVDTKQAKPADMAAVYGRKREYEWTPPLPDYTATSLNRPGIGEGVPLPRFPFDEAFESLEDEAAFGTLCHAIMETLITGDKNPKSIPEALLLPFRKSRRKSLLTQAWGMCEKALEGELGAILSKAEKKETETAFTYCLKNGPSPIFIHGRMDLLVETADTTFVVDFKSDKHKQAGAYDVQLSVYAAAAETFTGKSVSAGLCYLRTGELEYLSKPLPPEEWPAV